MLFQKKERKRKEKEKLHDVSKQVNHDTQGGLLW